MMSEERINELATEIAKCYASSKTMCSSSEFVELFLDIRDVAKEMIIQRENKKVNVSDISDNIPEDIDMPSSYIR